MKIETQVLTREVAAGAVAVTEQHSVRKQTSPRPRRISPKLRRAECPASMPKSLVIFLIFRHWMPMTTRIRQIDQCRPSCLRFRTTRSRNQTNSLIRRWSLPLWTQHNLWILDLFSHRSGQQLLLCLFSLVVCSLGVYWNLQIHPLLSEEMFSISSINQHVSTNGRLKQQP